MTAEDDEDLFDHSMNRAYGQVANELRLTALRRGVDSLEGTVTVARLVALATGFMRGQAGHAPPPGFIGSFEASEIEELPDVPEPVPEKLRASALKLASKWHAVADGEEMRMTVTAPTRTR